jgi:hypothetical protein
MVGWHRNPLVIPFDNPLVLSLTKAFDTSQNPKYPNKIRRKEPLQRGK